MAKTELYSSDVAAERIAALINSRPRSPTISEMAAIIAEAQIETAEADAWPLDKLASEIHGTIMEVMRLYDGPKPTPDADCQRIEALEAHLVVLEKQLPERPTTLTEIIAFAQVAWVNHDHAWEPHHPGTWQLDYDDGDCHERTVANLIKAVLRFAGLGKAYRLEG